MSFTFLNTPRLVLMQSFFVLLIAVCSWQASYGQVKVGPALGFNLSNVAINDGNIYQAGEAKLGIRIGGTVQAPLSEAFAVQIGALYSVKGFMNENVIATYRYLNYIEVPLTVLYTYDVNPRISLQGQLGGYAGFGVGGFLGIDPGADGIDFNPLDVGFMAAVGPQVNFNKSVLQIKVGYQGGLADLVNEIEPDIWLNQSFIISFDYLFELGN